MITEGTFDSIKRRGPMLEQVPAVETFMQPVGWIRATGEITHEDGAGMMAG